MNRISRRVPVVTAAGLAGVTALAVTAGVAGATSATPTTHTRHFISRQLQVVNSSKTQQLASDRLVAHGKTIGFDATDCKFNIPAKVLHCSVAASLKGGLLYGRLSVDATNGVGSGHITGGTGAYKGVSGTVATHPGKSQRDTKVTIKYHH